MSASLPDDPDPRPETESPTEPEDGQAADPSGPSDAADEPSPGEGLDFDAEFERMVAGWTPTGALDKPGDAPSPPEAAAPESSAGTATADPRDSDERLRNLFRGAWPEDEPQRAQGDDPAEHFVPPPAPPIPRPDPPRLLAWGGLFGAPLLALLLLLLGSLPSWGSFLLFAWFVGGFGYLIATMRRGGREGWDDGAQV